MPRSAARPRPIPAKPAKPTPEGSLRRRAGAALVESATLETVLDRILVKRLRPLRADATAARKAFEEQVTLRVEADARATRLESEAQGLRTRVAELEQELEASRQPRGTWFRRRSLTPRSSEA